MFRSYDEFVGLLNSIGFRKFYQATISNRTYSIDYGKRKGRIGFDSIIMAAEKYAYEATGKYIVDIDAQLPILLDKENIDNHELILQCIEVFDWGRVQRSNIMAAIELHRAGKLSDYLSSCKTWFEDDSTTELENKKVFWSSGWTKVYSFMFDTTTIYDSRVAAFINYMLTKFYYELEDDLDRKKLVSITSKLVSFNGSAERKRCVSSVDRSLLNIKMKSGNNVRNFIANKTASWLVRYLTDLEFSSITQRNFRQIDKAAFMLGFDIAQIEEGLNFE